MNGLGGGAKTVCPRARETLGTSLDEGRKFEYAKRDCDEKLSANTYLSVQRVSWLQFMGWKAN